MKCPICGAVSEVKHTRVTLSGVTRSRVCYNEHVFSTREVAVTKLLVVVDPLQMGSHGASK